MTTSVLLVVAAVVLVSLTGGEATAQEPPYGVAAEPWPAEYGNYRAVVEVAEPGEAALVRIPWRRRDHDPETKRILVVHEASGTQVADVQPLSLSRAEGTIAFRPSEGPGRYHVYYLPFAPQDYFGGYVGGYLPPEYEADPDWVASHGLDGDQAGEGLPVAEVIGTEARTEFSRLDPMKIIMTEAEREALLARYPGASYLVFPETRQRPVWMLRDLPRDWRDGPAADLQGEALRGEFYPFQLAVWAARRELRDVTVEITDLVTQSGERLPSEAFRCINTGGTDWTGEPLTKRVVVPEGEVRALWCGALIPEDAAPGIYTGEAVLRAQDAQPTTVPLTIEVLPEVVEAHGDNELWRFSRLRWLDSTIALDDELVEPYTGVEVDGRRLSLLGREIALGRGGLPAEIRCGDEALLARGVSIAPVVDGQAPRLTRRDVDFTHQAPGAVEWESSSAAGDLSIATHGRLEMDGHMTIRLRLRADSQLALDDLRLDIPLRPEAATYLMGIGHDGGRRPEEWSWHWDAAAYFDSFWIGDVDAGVQLELRGADYTGPMANLYWRLGQLDPPAAWHNGGAGGCRIFEEGGAVIARAFTGPTELAAGEELELEFALLITPVKPLDPASHFRTRYYHAYSPIEDIAQTGANVVNIHHGSEINPYINYPFIQTEAMAEYIRQAHEHDLRVKIYYTLRELTNHVREMPALLMLDDEVIAPGDDGGYPWLREHLHGNYTPAWYQPLDPEPCAAIVNSGESRWYNYYLEGLDWLAREVEIDGLYLDDVSFDRRILKRVRKILKRQRPGSLIDLHSNTGFSIQPANQYMEFFPYIDRLWFGESFNYEREPDYWLTEISGIPFGLMGEMLQDGGNPWRGMLYGMTTRMPWSGNPGALWRAWDDFGIDRAEMLGYWDDGCPVSTGRDDILATAYVRNDTTLVSIATWALEPEWCDLSIDWDGLGLDPDRATIYAPAIEDFQEETLFQVGKPIPVVPRRGWLLIVSEEAVEAPPFPGFEDQEAGKWETVFVETFEDGLPAEWDVRMTDYLGTTVEPVDDAIEIHSEAHRSAYIERELPPEVGMVVAKLNPGDDGGQTWGIGVGLGFGEKFLRINLRAGEGRTGVDGGIMQMLDPGPVEPGRDAWLRLRMDDRWIYAEMSTNGEWWLPIRTLERRAFPGWPDRVAVGKMHPHGRVEDAGLPSEWGDCRILEVGAYRRSE